jgi:hypothetical protein
MNWKCRLCENPTYHEVLDLGRMSFTGIFPKEPFAEVPKGDLVLFMCKQCALVQLSTSFNRNILFGSTYGYRSGLNQSMVDHLEHIKTKALRMAQPVHGDRIIDIGANDGTLLNAFAPNVYDLVAVDPLAHKFRRFYNKGIRILPNFFSEAMLRDKAGDKPASIVTTIAMFYDLDNPIGFARDVHSLLKDGGLWILELAYFPSMLRNCAFDQICHEHVAYYGLKQIQLMADRLGFSLVEVEFSNINGGSFCVTLKKQKRTAPSSFPSEDITIEDCWRFAEKVMNTKGEIKRFVENIHSNGKVVFGYGASTKGNVLLQYCGLDYRTIPFIAEVNEDKFGAFTPGSAIPIISETEAMLRKPDYYFVLPWHFKENIVKRCEPYLKAGGKLIFPLPKMEVVG